MKIRDYFVLTLLISSFMFFTSCDEAVWGSGNVVQEEREVQPFTAIDISGGFNLFLTQGTEVSLVVEADDNLQQYIQTYVRGGKLYVDTRGVSFRRSTARLHVTVVDLKEIDVSGAVKIVNETPLEFNRLSIDISGAADINMELYGERLNLTISGAGKSNLSGEVKEVYFKLSGASKLEATRLYTSVMDVEISGAGKAEVNVDEKLRARISGAGNIRYIGDPEVRREVSGAGSIKKMEE